MIYCTPVNILLLMSSVFPISECTIDLNMPELQYLSDHLTQEECHKLVAALHFQTFNVPQQVAAAERKLPDDVPCLQLLLHWNSESGEGKGGTHVEVCHRLNQIGRRDLAEWLSQTVFHELSKDLDDSMLYSATDETSRSRPIRVTEATRKPVIIDEAPWWNLDSVLALLVLITLTTFACGSFYLVCLCCVRIHRAAEDRKYEKLLREQQQKSRAVRKSPGVIINRPPQPDLPSSEDETLNLIVKNKE